MTEPEWLATDNPFRLFQHVKSRLSARKLQLLACGCCRLLDPLLTADQQAALGVVERHADGLADNDELQRAKEQYYRDVTALTLPTPTGGSMPPTAEAATAEALLAAISVPIDIGLRRVHELVEAAAARAPVGGGRSAAKELRRRMCLVYHEIVGNPFLERRVASPEYRARGGGVTADMLRVGETARAIAIGVQAEQAFDRLPILADALEDDGCTDTELLDHLRHTSHHLRGCWAVDLVLGKS